MRIHSIRADWYPKDYNITPYLGEFVNTLTNVVYGSFPFCDEEDSRAKKQHQRCAVIYGAYGLRRVRPHKDGGLWSTLAFPYWGLVGVGVLSMWFHATLKYHSQMGKVDVSPLSLILAVRLHFLHVRRHLEAGIFAQVLDLMTTNCYVMSYLTTCRRRSVHVSGCRRVVTPTPLL